MTCFLISWTQHDLRQQILDFLDTIPEIVNWRASSGAILLVSELSARQLSDKINDKFGTLTFLLTPIDIQTIEGVTDRKTWNFIRHPRNVNDEPNNEE